MKYRVDKAFIDRLTQKPYNEGYTYETEDKERAKELAAGGYIIMPKGKGNEPDNEPPEGEEVKPDNPGDNTPEGVSESDTKTPEGEGEQAKGKKTTAKTEKNAAK